jgi:hypothetical protein
LSKRIYTALSEERLSLMTVTAEAFPHTTETPTAAATIQWTGLQASKWPPQNRPLTQGEELPGQPQNRELTDKPTIFVYGAGCPDTTRTTVT